MEESHTSPPIPERGEVEHVSQGGDGEDVKKRKRASVNEIHIFVYNRHLDRRDKPKQTEIPMLCRNFVLKTNHKAIQGLIIFMCMCACARTHHGTHHNCTSNKNVLKLGWVAWKALVVRRRETSCSSNHCEGEKSEWSV